MTTLAVVLLFNTGDYLGHPCWVGEESQLQICIPATMTKDNKVPPFFFFFYILLAKTLSIRSKHFMLILKARSKEIKIPKNIAYYFTILVKR